MKIRFISCLLAGLVFETSVLKANDAFEFTVYRTLPGATVEERGDRIPTGVRVVPISATFHLDPTATTPDNFTLVPLALLKISPVAGNAVEISWSSHFADHVLEHATHLIPTDWSTVTNAVVTRGDQLLILREHGESSQRYFRLRKP